VIISLNGTYPAKTLEEARERATEMWRTFMHDPEAELPWDAAIKVEVHGTESVATLAVRVEMKEEPRGWAR
jgi:hypothetical protein